MPRGEQQNQRMRDERQERISSAALHLFSTRGLAATRIADIAERAGMSQGLLYHYFATKEQIYVELIRSATERVKEATLALEQLPLSPREKIVQAMGGLVRRLDEDEDFARYFMLTAQLGVSSAIPEEAVTIHRRHRALPYEVIARIIRAGQRDGSVRKYDPDQMAVVFWTMVKGLAMHRASFGRSFQAPDPRILTAAFLLENDNT